MLEDGSIIIDTPGMREFGVTLDGDDDQVNVHPQIDELAQACRFSDCTHLQEPGCAVVEALEAGILQREVFNSYIKLMKEQRRFQISVTEQKRSNKMFGRLMKEVKSHRRDSKY